jgi:hypothetical protein
LVLYKVYRKKGGDRNGRKERKRKGNKERKRKGNKT